MIQRLALAIAFGAAVAVPAVQPAGPIDDLRVAMRYDASRVVFFVAEDDGREPDLTANLAGLEEMAPAVAQYLGGALFRMLRPIEPYASRLSGLKLGERWTLLMGGPHRPAGVTVTDYVLSDAGCFPQYGGLAEVDAAAQDELMSTPQKYFLLRKGEPEFGDVGPAAPSSRTVGMRPSLSAARRGALEDMLRSAMPSQLQQVRGPARPNQLSSRDRRWDRLNERLAAGDGRLEYDVQSFDLAPDGVPRWFVRAEWRIGNTSALLLAFWIRAGHPLVIEAIDADASRKMRMSEFERSSLDRSWLGAVLNNFDIDRDGWSELLMYEKGYEARSITLLRYSKQGPQPTRISYAYGC